MSSTAELPFLDVDVLGTGNVRFSYSRPDDKPMRKAVIRLIEFMTGQPRLRRSYERWSLERPRADNIFAAGIRQLGITLNFDAVRFKSIPKTGPLLVVANHPFGVADGLAIGDLMLRVRSDVKIMTHSLLCQPPEAQNHLLPVDFGGTRDARQRSAETRMQAMAWLRAGHCVVIFPAGGVATRQKPLKGRALDLPWHSFTAKLASVAGVRVLPLYFAGENSLLFHLASHSWYPLRAALLFRETLKRSGTALQVTIGQTVDGAALPHGDGREAVVKVLKERTFALAESASPDLHLDFVWPAHIRW